MTAVRRQASGVSQSSGASQSSGSGSQDDDRAPKAMFAAVVVVEVVVLIALWIVGRYFS